MIKRLRLLLPLLLAFLPGLGVAQTCLTNECGAAVEGLRFIPLAPGDPINLFVLNQTCIALRACELRQKMENPAWLERVISRFVEEYLRKTNDWPGVLADCRAMILSPEALCADRMARYHIRTDLQAVLQAEGCGTAADWDLIGEIIRRCLAEVGGWVNEAAQGIIPIYRYETRQSCLDYRHAAKLPPYANAP